MFFQAGSLELALFHVPRRNRAAIQFSGSVVSRLNRPAMASLTKLPLLHSQCYNPFYVRHGCHALSVKSQNAIKAAVTTRHPVKH